MSDTAPTAASRTAGFAARADMLDSRLFRSGAADAAHVARAGHRALRQGKTLVVPGLRNRLLAFAVRLAPRALVRRVTAYMQA